MKYIINKNVIDDFREIVNSNTGFVYEQYHNINDKNHWSLICSCMDWINVSVSYLESYDFETKNIDIKSMQVYTYISAIDIIHQAVNQLHRVFIHEDSIPFHGITSIFHENNLFDDNTYFKQIRAAFGAHPVNLKDDNGKRFASWPTDKLIGHNYDFQVFLYSADVYRKDVIWGFRFDELNSFLHERYTYLNYIGQQIIVKYNDFKNRFSSVPIVNDENILNQLLILQKESKQRLNLDYYKDIIDELIVIFSCDVILDNFDYLFERYKHDLLPLINELKNKLQKMDFSDLEYDSILNPKYPSKIGYPVSKLFNADFYEYNDPLFGYYIKELNDYSNGIYNFDIKESRNKTYIKVKLMLYYGTNI